MKGGTILGILASLVATNAYAFIAPTEAPAGVKVKSPVLRPGLYKSEVGAFDASTSSVFMDRQSNSLRQMSGQSLLGVKVTKFTQEAFEKAALDAVAAHPDLFGVDLQDVQINPKGTHVDPIDQIVNLQVTRNGLRIQDAGITFRFKSGNLVSLKAETFAEAVISDSNVTDTAKIATNALNSQGYIARGSKWRVVPTAAGYSLVKVDEYVVAGLDAAWIVQVNTTNGELFEVRSKNMNLRGRAVASAYPRYFGEAIQETPLPFSSVTNASSRANERGEFQSNDDFTAPQMNGFAGQFVIVNNMSGTNLAATAKKDTNSWQLKFDIQPTEKLWDNNDIAQSMVYINANTVISTAKKFISPTWFNAPLKANVNHSRHCNAYWDGETVNFFTAGDYNGKTCANTGVIADVVYHEWGHGLDDNTGGIEDGALSEGFGDAVALLFTDDSKIGIEFLPITHKPARDLTVLKKYPDDVTDEVHADGIIFGGAMYDMYTELKRTMTIDKAKELYAKFLFKGIYSYAKMTDAYEAILAIDDNDANRENGTPNLCIINKAFVRHGLATADSRCARRR